MVTAPQALSASDVTRVELTVSGTGMTTRTDALVKTAGQWGGVLGQLPAGTGRTFSAQAFDASNTVRYAGQVTPVTIQAAQTTAVTLLLQEVNAPLPFENAAPRILSLVASPGTVSPGGQVTLQATVDDPNAGDVLISAWTASTGSFGAASSLTTAWTAPAFAGPVVLTLTVTDSKGASAALSVTVAVSTGTGSAAVNVTVNTWPQVATVTALPSSVVVGQATAVSAVASDADGDSLSYQWTTSCAGTWANATSASAGFTPSAQPSGGTCTLTVVASDGRGGQGHGSLGIYVGPGTSGRIPPEVVEAFQSVATAPAAGGTVVFRVRAKDPQGSVLTFAWTASTGTLSTATSTASTSEVLWTAPSCVSVSTTIIATVTNAFGFTVTQSFAVTGLPACGPSGWASTGFMATHRYGHMATLLPTGKVLVSGGQSRVSYLATAEVYDPASGTWSATGSMASPRYLHSATLLPNGKVLVSGGQSGSSYLATAEVYDPASGTWSTTGSMASPRYYHSATLLPNGKVLVSGGSNSSGYVAAEVFDPATGTWSAAGSMASPRDQHTAALLLNGKVLVSGGRDNSGAIATAEEYDPAANTWSTTGSMTSARRVHKAALLNNGKVLVSGGINSLTRLATAEVYDPTSGTWSTTGSMASARREHSATLLPNSKVLAAGGNNTSGTLATAEVYDPASGTWSTTGSMASSRDGYTATLLPNGQVLVSGGLTGSSPFAAAELYTP
ncbi:kelch repeat-containing protein [Corallococcus sp. AB049A]|uniref:kelch repeat-containing protein n=1 Tax=Corallococcus sp. AB049A TaxID=2316721 RepID=UPI001F45C498|nr:kelch repeat-containing protein [Corallococcus sp. AB049A]